MAELTNVCTYGYWHPPVAPSNRWRCYWPYAVSSGLPKVRFWVGNFSVFSFRLSLWSWTAPLHKSSWALTDRGWGSPQTAIEVYLHLPVQSVAAWFVGLAVGWVQQIRLPISYICWWDCPVILRLGRFYQPLPPVFLHLPRAAAPSSEYSAQWQLPPQRRLACDAIYGTVPWSLATCREGLPILFPNSRWRP